MIAIKPGVKVAKIQPEILLAVMVAQDLWPEGVTITSGSEGQHMNGSLHYNGFAVDLRLPKENKEEVTAELARLLGEEYDVILEKDHIHVEYDPK